MKIYPMSKNEAVDPVCGMSLQKNAAAATVEYSGKTYYFCSDDCKQKFDLTPESYR
jgi:Cu+-exporting ATPase